MVDIPVGRCYTYKVVPLGSVIPPWLAPPPHQTHSGATVVHYDGGLRGRQILETYIDGPPYFEDVWHPYHYHY
jgi:hypothetical protein